MALVFHNTLTRQKEEFVPIEEGKVRLYVCGPTIYNFAHIGNFRAYICSDILRRYLEFKGFDVFQVMNLTDVDDKTIRDSQKEGVSLDEFTTRYGKAFFEDLDTLNIVRARVFPKATEHIQEMVDIIKKLRDAGYTYEKDGSIYFKISKFDKYGELSGIKVDELKAGARVNQDEYTKEDAHDFALWKAWDENDGDVFWETDIGKGRPGWHIECSAMSMKHLGEHFDIHTGGIDLVFPHHTNEIAQSECCTGTKFVNYWLHNEWMLVEGKKMSKSLGNFFTLRDLLEKKYDPKSIRYLLLSTHYRQPLNFTFDGLEAADKAVTRMQDFVFNMLELEVKEGAANDEVEELVTLTESEFVSAMDDDLNVSSALGKVFDCITAIYSRQGELTTGDVGSVVAFMKKVNSIVGVLDFEKGSLDSEIDALIAKREEARAQKDFATADKIRDDLKAQGIVLEDTPSGVRWKRQ